MGEGGRERTAKANIIHKLLCKHRALLQCLFLDSNNNRSNRDRQYKLCNCTQFNNKKNQRKWREK